MLRIDSPPDLAMMQAIIRKVANFEFETDDYIKENLWGFTDEEYVDTYTLQAGYDSKVLMFNMGLELYFFFGFLFLILTVNALKSLHCGC